MAKWFKFGIYISTIGFILDVYLHQLGLAIIMLICIYVNYVNYEKWEAYNAAKSDSDTLE